MLTIRRAGLPMQSYCCSIFVAPSALHADMDRALRIQSRIEQLGMLSSPPGAAWRRSPLQPGVLWFWLV
eukprot:6355293-Lingulodinium_polyedra.AAC.1